MDGSGWGAGARAGCLQSGCSADHAHRRAHPHPDGSAGHANAYPVDHADAHRHTDPQPNTNRQPNGNSYLVGNANRYADCNAIADILANRHLDRNIISNVNPHADCNAVADIISNTVNNSDGNAIADIHTNRHFDLNAISNTITDIFTNCQPYSNTVSNVD